MKISAKDHNKHRNYFYTVASRISNVILYLTLPVYFLKDAKFASGIKNKFFVFLTYTQMCVLTVYSVLS